MVVFNHLGGLLLDASPATWNDWYVPLLMPTGFQWVWLFLALSGFLLTKAFLQKRFKLDKAGILAFYESRARRLIPLLWSASILWIILFFSLQPLGWWPSKLPTWSWKREVGVAFAFPWAPYFSGTNPIGSVNSPVWSAILEIHYCILMPLLLMWIGKPKRLIWIALAWVLLMMVLLVSVAARGRPTIFPDLYGAHIFNAGFFLAGMLMAAYSPVRLFKAASWSLVVFVVATAMLVAQYLAFYDVNLALAVSPLFVLFAVCLLISRADDTYQLKLPGNLKELTAVGWSPLSWLERLGVMSYSIYLLHKPIGYIFLQSALSYRSPGEIWQYGLVLICTTVPIIIICACFYLLVENRFRKRRLA
jgi:peptidoglycan/LPS O-acetylase OafA/YrhL